MEADRELKNAVTELVESMDLFLVEMSIGRHRGDVKINLVLYKDGGIGLDDLTEAQKTIRPRLELGFDRGGLSLEISSPGTSRTFKDSNEYKIFKGREVRLLIGDEWTQGTIESADDKAVNLQIDGGVHSFAISNVKKAKLV